MPRTEEFVVLIPEGAVLVRAVHRLSEDRKWDTEFMSKVKGAPWDFKANAGDDTNDGGFPEGVDARPPDPPLEIPPRISVSRKYVRRVDVEKYGPTHGCAGFLHLGVVCSSFSLVGSVVFASFFGKQNTTESNKKKRQ